MIAQLDRDYIRRRPWKAVTRLVSYAGFEGRPVTTRGRWINPLVFGWLRIAARLPLERPEAPPVYIIGTGRSGTTILGKVLSLHPRVGFLNEPKAMWHVICPREDVIGNYSRGEASYRLGRDEATRDAVATAHRLYGVYARTVGAETVLDKYPEVVFRIPFVRCVFPDARFLFLVRDGWDTIRSIDRWSERLGVEPSAGDTHDWWGVDDRKWRLLVRDVVSDDPRLGDHADAVADIGRHLDRAAVEWAVTIREGAQWLERLPDQLHLVRYERLVREPERCLVELLDFCRLERDPEVLDYGREVLRPTDHKGTADLHPLVKPAFAEMMDRMGYER